MRVLFNVFLYGLIMSIEELIAKAASSIIDDSKLDELQDRLKAAEEKFEEEAKSKSVDRDFLSRAYSL